MEFGQKLQELRKQKGMTQEELAQTLYVSRAAVSKWESGRGYPNIDSLKAIAKFYGVTVDALLSCEEVLTIAKEDQKQREALTRGRVFALLDVSSILLFALPLFGQRSGSMALAVPLWSMTGIAPYLKAAYIIAVLGLAAVGAASLMVKRRRWEKAKDGLSLLLNAAAVLLFVISLQPYAAILLFVYLMIKVLMLVKKL